MKSVLKLLVALCVFGGVCAFVFYKPPQVRSFEENLTKAKQGNLDAILRVADNYARGVGVKQNGAEAINWYEKAVAQDNAEAFYQLAQIYRDGKLTAVDAETALAYLRAAAEKGNPNAQNELGNYYQKGLFNLPRSQGEGLLWKLRASAQGHSDAAKTVALASTQTPELFAAVAQFEINLQKAAKQDAPSMLALGHSYRKGVPVARNDEEAYKWFLRAWQIDSTLSQAAFELAEMNRLGEGVLQDETQAMEFYNAAALLKNPQAQYYLGTLSYASNPPNYKDAFAWFSNAAAQGMPQGQYMTGFMLLQGQGMKKSVPMAVDFFRKAAEQNHAPAQYVLGQMYWKGLGIKKDLKEGKKWLSLAAENGNQAAQQLLAQ